MRARLLALVVMAGCFHEPKPRPVTPVVPEWQKPVVATTSTSSPALLRRRSIAALTPNVIFGAVLGQPYDELARARSITPENEDYDFRDHYIEHLDADGITTVHYYTLPKRGAMYQISFDFDVDDKAEELWRPFLAYGYEIADLGGREIVIDRYEFQIRVWLGSRRMQIMAVIPDSEWWDQYHPNDKAVDDPDADPP